MKKVLKIIMGFVQGGFLFLLALILGLCLLFSPRSASREELLSYQLMLEQGLQSYGFTGEVELTKFRPIAIGNPWDVLEYDYTEVVDGQSITLHSSDTLFNDQIEGKEELQGMLSMSVYFDDSPSSILYRFDGIADQAMWHQPRGKFLLEQAKEAFVEMEERGFTLFEIEGRLENQDEKLTDFYQKVEENRRKGGAFAGFYDIDLDWLIEKDLAVIEVEFLNKQSPRGDSSREIEKKLIADLHDKVETFDYSQVEDGTYRIGFRTPSTQSVEYFVTIRVENHRYSSVE